MEKEKEDFKGMQQRTFRGLLLVKRGSISVLILYFKFQFCSVLAAFKVIFGPICFWPIYCPNSSIFQAKAVLCILLGDTLLRKWKKKKNLKAAAFAQNAKKHFFEGQMH